MSDEMFVDDEFRKALRVIFKKMGAPPEVYGHEIVEYLEGVQEYVSEAAQETETIGAEAGDELRLLRTRIDKIIGLIQKPGDDYVGLRYETASIEGLLYEAEWLRANFDEEELVDPTLLAEFQKCVKEFYSSTAAILDILQRSKKTA